MQLVTYQTNAQKTAVYPAKFKLLYPTLGLVGEIAEFIESLEQGTREDQYGEAGDVLWYVANTSADAGLRFDVVLPGVNEFSDITFAYGDLLSPVGKIAERVKKCARDDGNVLSPDKRAVIRTQLGVLLQNLAGICDLNGIDLDRAAEGNNEKLASRARRGVLQGEGGNR